MAKGGFRGPMGGGMNMNMIKQAQKMQQDMLKMQEELEVKQYEAAAGGGVVKAVVNGKHEVVSLTIDPEAVDPEDVEMLQDMVVAAVNEAMRKAEAEASQNMSRLTGGLNLAACSDARFPAALERLTEQFAKLPGIGGKTAQRLAFYLLSQPQEEAEEFADALLEARRSVHLCPVCQNLTDRDICPICEDEERDHGLVCVVAEQRMLSPWSAPGNTTACTMCCTA